MSRRWFIFILFLAVVGIGGYLRRSRSPASDATWKASIVLERNTRISRIHLKRPDLSTPASAWNLPELSTLEGKFVVNKIDKDASVTAKALSDSPKLDEIKNTTILFYSTRDLGLAGTQVNAGAKLYVCDIEKECRAPYMVEAIVGEKEPYTIALRVPNDDASYLQKLAKVQVRLASLP